MAYGLRPMANVSWQMAHGLRLTAYGLWLTTYGLWLTAYGLRLTFGVRVWVCTCVCVGETRPPVEYPLVANLFATFPLRVTSVINKRLITDTPGNV